MTTFNPYQSGGVTKTVVTPNFSSYNANNTYANFTPASVVNSYGQQPHGAPQYSAPMGPRGGGGGGGDNRYHRGGRGGGGYRNNNNNRQYNRMAPRDEVSKYYCETCCCDCLGKDSWTAHVKGQQHLKKLKLAASQKAAASCGTSSGSAMTSVGSACSGAGASSFAQNFCEICNCHCTNPDAFAAHIRGQKHQKAIKLHMKMGKTIPESLQPQVVKVIPKTNFTTGGTLITGQVYQVPATNQGSGNSSGAYPGSGGFVGVTAVPVSSESQGGASVNGSDSKPERPTVGMEYIVEEKDAMGKIINYKCTICKCDMNNIYMRDDHLKGRKHLTEYKMKVNPNLKVSDPKLKTAFNQIEKLQYHAEQEELRKRQMRENSMLSKVRSRENELLRAYPECVQISSYKSADDNLIISKHSEINPTPLELKAADKFLGHIELSLKAVAEKLHAENEKKVKELKGVMRVGFFAKSIFLKGEKQLELVVLCEKKPTEALAANVCQTLGEKLEELIKDEKFLVSWSAKNAWITVKSQSENGYQCSIHLTSPEMRGDLDPSLDSPGVLDKDKCTTSLAETRRSKWFDSKCKVHPSLCLVVRILRDLCRRIPTWNLFPCYIIELLCDKALRTVAHEMGPAELMRRFFEIIASGILLPNEPGIFDPCEKNNFNAASCIKVQDCQDITTSSQHALRLMALGQTDKILGTADKKRKAATEGASYSNSTSSADNTNSEESGESSNVSYGNRLPGHQNSHEYGNSQIAIKPKEEQSSPAPPPAKKERPTMRPY